MSPLLRLLRLGIACSERPCFGCERAGVRVLPLIAFGQSAISSCADVIRLGSDEVEQGPDFTEGVGRKWMIAGPY